MPKKAVYNTIARQWELLKLMPTRGPGLTALALAQRLRDAGFTVSKRTVERDLVELSGPFGIRCNDSSKPYGWLWMQDQGLALPGLDLTDALSLILVEDLLRKLVPVPLLRVLEPKFKQAREKLASITNYRYANWTDKVRFLTPTLPFLAPTIEPRVLETVQESLLQGRQLLVSYCGLNDARARELTLHPLAFIQQGPVAYIVATAFTFTDPRLYALHRMRSAKLTQEPSTLKGFALDAYLKKGGMQFGEGGAIKLKAKVSTKLACYLAESPLTHDQRLVPQGKSFYELSATIKDSWHLHFWILSQGAEITVIQPKSLRKQILEQLKAAVGAYSGVA